MSEFQGLLKQIGLFLAQKPHFKQNLFKCFPFSLSIINILNILWLIVALVFFSECIVVVPLFTDAAPVVW